jgi:hypothetical protein
MRGATDLPRVSRNSPPSEKDARLHDPVPFIPHGRKPQEKLVPCRTRHGSTSSGVGASGKSGAVHPYPLKSPMRRAQSMRTKEVSDTNRPSIRSALVWFSISSDAMAKASMSSATADRSHADSSTRVWIVRSIISLFKTLSCRRMNIC